MNRITRITRIAAVTLTLAAAGSAFADDITIDTNAHASTKARADVLVELAAHKQAGVNPWSTSYNVLTAFHAQRARADVQAEAMIASASGELAAMTAEDSGSAYLTQARQAQARQAQSGLTFVAAVR